MYVFLLRYSSENKIRNMIRSIKSKKIDLKKIDLTLLNGKVAVGMSRKVKVSEEMEESSQQQYD